MRTDSYVVHRALILNFAFSNLKWIVLNPLSVEFNLPAKCITDVSNGFSDVMLLFATSSRGRQTATGRPENFTIFYDLIFNTL
jgi:hypothetical protein